MSIRRAIEYNMKTRIEGYLNNTKYPVIESQRQEERPIPCVLIVAGDATPAFDIGEHTGNYEIPFNIVIISSLDKSTVDEHDSVVQSVLAIMRDPKTRTKSLIKNLYLYAVHQNSTSEDNGDRRMGMIIGFTAVVNYSPDLPQA